MEKERLLQNRPKSSPISATSSNTTSKSPALKRPATALSIRVSVDEYLQDTDELHSEGKAEQQQLSKGTDNGVESLAEVGDHMTGTNASEGWTEGSKTNTDKCDLAKKSTMNDSTRVKESHIHEESPVKYNVDYSSVRHLLELTDGETDLDSDKEIPDIYSKTSQLKLYSEITGLKDGLLGREVKPYLDEFHGSVQQEQLMVGKMSLEQVEAEEKRLQEEYLAFQEQESHKQRERQEQIATSQEKAKREVQKSLRKRRKALLKREAGVVQSTITERKRIYSAFSKAEQNMKVALEARKGEIKALYGDLERAHGYYGAVKGRRWKVDWTKAPQPVQIKMKTLRGIRDKLPGSRYLLLVSLYDRLGGHVLRWSKLKGQQWGAATMPVQHQGHFYNTEMKFDQSVYTVLPSKPNVSPSMVLTFEVFVLRGPASPTDQVVGWGVFPICDAEFNIIGGKYKCPLLRGSIDPLITKHSKMEQLMTSDLENWLGNLYFEVVKLPRYLRGMHEYEVELQFTSSLMGQPDRTHDENNVIDGREPVLGMEGDSPSTGDLRRLLSPSLASSENVSSFLGEPHDTGQTSVVDHVSPNAARTGLTSRLSRRYHSGYARESESESSIDEEKQEISKFNDPSCDEDNFLPVNGKPGLFYKVHSFNPFVEQQREVQTLLPHSSVLEENTVRKGWDRKKKKTKKKLSYDNELKEHTISIHPPFSTKGRIKRRMHERLQYLGRQFLSEMGLSQWKSLEFWSMVIVFILCWWIRLYLHYVAQYGFLRISDIPVNRFEFYPHTVILHYQSSLLFTREEVAIVLLGPFFNTFIFCCLILLSWTFQKVFVSIPDLGSMFIAAYGVQVVLDPYWILVVDMALFRFNPPQPDLPTADITKLYWHFDRLEGSGVVGIFLTLFLYIFTTFVSLACFYMYFLRVHMNGKLIDIYHRLKSSEEKLFVPHDLELSSEELGFICRKAEQWRGADGERRKVAVHDYIWEDEEKERNKETNFKLKRRRRHKREVTTHISIHTLHLDGLRELHRHFLRLDDGAIIEIFGDISSVAGISSRITQRGRSSPNASKQSLSSLAYSETSFKHEEEFGSQGSSSGDLKRVPFPPVPQHVSPTHSEHRHYSLMVEQNDVGTSYTSLEVPVQRLASPYNRHRGPEYKDEDNMLEVSLTIPDINERPSEDVNHDSSLYTLDYQGNSDDWQNEKTEYSTADVEATLNSNESFEDDREDKPLVDSSQGMGHSGMEQKLNLKKQLSAGQLV